MQRKGLSPECFRLCLFKLEFLLSVVKPQEFVVADPDCLHRVEEAIQHRILRNSGYFGTVDRPLCSSCTPRKGTLKDVILLVGGGNTEAMGLAQTWGYVVGMMMFTVKSRSFNFP